MTDDELKADVAAARTDPLRAGLNKQIIATAESILTAPPIRQNTADMTVHEQERYAVYYIVTEAMKAPAKEINP